MIFKEIIDNSTILISILLFVLNSTSCIAIKYCVRRLTATSTARTCVYV